MDDILNCPICGKKLRTCHLPNKRLYAIDKTADYTERVCTKGYNHVLILWSDKDTKMVDLLKISLDPKSSRFIEIDFVNEKGRITCANSGKYEYIEVPRLLVPDFPLLEKLREKVDLFIMYS